MTGPPPSMPAGTRSPPTRGTRGRPARRRLSAARSRRSSGRAPRRTARAAARRTPGAVVPRHLSHRSGWRRERLGRNCCSVIARSARPLRDRAPRQRLPLRSDKLLLRSHTLNDGRAAARRLPSVAPSLPRQVPGQPGTAAAGRRRRRAAGIDVEVVAEQVARVELALQRWRRSIVAGGKASPRRAGCWSVSKER